MKTDGGGPYLSLAPHCALRLLETPTLYDKEGDELYELDEEAFSFIASSPPIDGAGDAGAAGLVETCIGEGLCRKTSRPHPVPLPVAPPSPTLRYLLVHITGRCNLQCRHCFLGEPTPRELDSARLFRLAGEFADLQGLRFIVSGGEPLLHSAFGEINDRIRDYPFRSILLSNGTLIDDARARALRFHEVQVSIDGLEQSHDLIRGRGAFRRAVDGLSRLADTGIDISVATMVHRANIDGFDELREFLGAFPLKSWSVDVPCLTGNFAGGGELAAAPEEAASKVAFSFGGGYYGSSGEYACGAHLAAVMADGSVCKCGHYGDRPAGQIDEGLAAAWSRMPRLRRADLSCRCSHIKSCRGGCRFRAELSSCQSGPDPIQCFQRGVPVGGDLVGKKKQQSDQFEGR